MFKPRSADLEVDSLPLNHHHGPLRLHQENTKEVDKFVDLGSVVSKDGG